MEGAKHERSDPTFISVHPRRDRRDRRGGDDACSRPRRRPRPPRLGGRRPGAASPWRPARPYTVAATTAVSAVTIEQGGVLTAPAGYSLTMTVNGVETGQVLTATSGADTVFVAGSWRGDIVLTVTEAVDVTWQSARLPVPPGHLRGLDRPWSSDDSVFAAASAAGCPAPPAPTACGSPPPASASTACTSRTRSYTLTRPHDQPRRQRPMRLRRLRRRAGGQRHLGRPWSWTARRSTTKAPCGPARSPRTARPLVVKNSSISVSNGVLPSDYMRRST